MATKICHQCRSEADVLAKVCPHCKAKLGAPRKDGVASKPTHGCVIALAIFLGFGLFGAIVNSISPTPNTRPSTATSIGTKAKQETLKPTPIQIDEANATIKKLTPHFTHEIDEFNKFNKYRHKSFTKFMNSDGTTIKASIVDNDLYGYSTYVSDDWIFHSSFIVKAGEATIEASGKEQHEVISGVCETVTPSQGEIERVLRFIAAHPKDAIRIRLIGKFRKDYTLRSAHQVAILETVRLADAMKMIELSKGS